MSDRIRKLNLLLASTILSLVGLELALQVLAARPGGDSGLWIASAATGYRAAPNLDLEFERREYRIRFRTNSLGFRDNELGPKVGPRIVLLGDSFAAGFGVERDEMYATLLEDETPAEIVNAAVGGYELIHQVRLFKSLGGDLEPDLVLLALYLGNDLAWNRKWRVTEQGLESLGPRFLLRKPESFELVERFRALSYRLRAWRADRGLPAWRPYPGYLALTELELTDEARSDYQTAQALLRELAGEVKATGAAFKVAMFSYRPAIEPDARRELAAEIRGFDSRYDLERPEREMGDFMAHEGIDFVNLNPELRRLSKEGLRPLYYRTDGHFTRAGHRAVASALAPHVRRWLEDLEDQPRGGDAGATGRPVT